MKWKFNYHKQNIFYRFLFYDSQQMKLLIFGIKLFLKSNWERQGLVKKINTKNKIFPNQIFAQTLWLVNYCIITNIHFSILNNISILLLSSFIFILRASQYYSTKQKL